MMISQSDMMIPGYYMDALARRSK